MDSYDNDSPFDRRRGLVNILTFVYNRKKLTDKMYSTLISQIFTNAKETILKISGKKGEEIFHRIIDSVIEECAKSWQYWGLKICPSTKREQMSVQQYFESFPEQVYLWVILDIDTQDGKFAKKMFEKISEAIITIITYVNVAKTNNPNSPQVIRHLPVYTDLFSHFCDGPMINVIDNDTEDLWSKMIDEIISKYLSVLDFLTTSILSTRNNKKYEALKCGLRHVLSYIENTTELSTMLVKSISQEINTAIAEADERMQQLCELEAKQTMQEIEMTQAEEQEVVQKGETQELIKSIEKLLEPFVGKFIKKKDFKSYIELMTLEKYIIIIFTDIFDKICSFIILKVKKNISTKMNLFLIETFKNFSLQCEDMIYHFVNIAGNNQEIEWLHIDFIETLTIQYIEMLRIINLMYQTQQKLLNNSIDEIFKRFAWEEKLKGSIQLETWKKLVILEKLVKTLRSLKCEKEEELQKKCILNSKEDDSDIKIFDMDLDLTILDIDLDLTIFNMERTENIRRERRRQHKYLSTQQSMEVDSVQSLDMELNLVKSYGIKKYVVNKVWDTMEGNLVQRFIVEVTIIDLLEIKKEELDLEFRTNRENNYHAREKTITTQERKQLPRKAS